MEFNIKLSQSKNGWTAYIDEIGGFTRGETLEETLRLVDKAIKLWFEVKE